MAGFSSGQMSPINNIDIIPSFHRDNNIYSVPNRICHNVPIEINRYDFPSIMSSNITGALCNKLDEINTVALQNNVDIICLSETWCNSNIPDESVQLNGFTTFRKDRQDGRAGGGVICYIRDFIPVMKIWNELNDEQLETLWITLRPRRLPRGITHVTICIVYHPPKANDWQMCQHLIHSFDSIKQRFPLSGFFIVGDFNHMKDKYFKSSCQVTQIVTKPTHMQSIIDLCYTSLSKFYKPPFHMPGIGVSKHQTLIFQPVFHSSKNPKSFVVYKRNQCSDNKLQLKQAIADVNWSKLYHAPTCKEKYEIFQDTMHELVNQYLPLQKVKRNTNDHPWVTDKFRSFIKKRQFYFLSGNNSMYCFYRNKVNRMRKQLKSQYVSKTMSSLKHSNPKNWWQKIKSLSGSNVKCDNLLSLAHSSCNGDVNSLADIVNDHFKDVSSHLLPLPVVETSSSHNIPDKFIISVQSVEKRLKNINVCKAPGPDDIPSWILKELYCELAPPVCALWNSSFRDSYVPQIWKSANTIPLPKTSPVLNIQKDLRPISLTPILCKGIEYYARDWFMDIFKSQIDEYQYGSQSECSTVIALAQLFHNWLLNLDSGKNVVRILLVDFSKAFDLVDHNILINKVSKTGAPEFLISWLHSFLCGRQQRVKIGSTFSKWTPLNAGVPQGTLLGPSTFLLHINDLKTDCNSVKYVDDTTIWETCDKRGENSNIQNAANQTFTWCQTNNMRLNTDKTKEMLIDFSKKPFNIKPICMNDSDIERVKSTKLLGVIINNTLTWNDHVDYICNKASKRLYFLRLLRRANIIPLDIVQVYCSTIRSLLEYACEVWHPGLSKQQCNKIEMIQKRALKVVFPELSYSEALLKTNIPTLSDRRRERCETFFNNMSNPTHKLHNLLPKRTNLPHLRSNRKYMLPRVRTNRLKNSPIFYGVFNFQ
jgi:hypothetical protein